MAVVVNDRDVLLQGSATRLNQVPLSSNIYLSLTTGIGNSGLTMQIVDDISSDDKLVPIEKQQLRIEWERIANEKPLLNAQALAFSLTTENDLYNTAFTSLGTFLNAGVAYVSGMPSLISDISLATTSDVIGSDLRAVVSAYFLARSNLLNDISLTNKQLADDAQQLADDIDLAVQDISSDNKMTPVEKSGVRLEWDRIAAEKTGLNAQATLFAITAENTTYNNAFQALGTYLNDGVAYSSGIPSWISDANLSVTTDIVGATFRSTVKTYYDARTALLNAIDTKTKTLAEEAQDTADTVNLLVTDIASDNKLTPVEKSSLRLEWDKISAEKAGLNSQATSFGLTALNNTYNTNFQTLATYLNNGVTYSSGVPSWISDANLSTTTNITGATLRTNVKNYYDARTALLNGIDTQTKSIADSASSTASAAASGLTTKLNKDVADTLSGQITLGVDTMGGIRAGTIAWDAVGNVNAGSGIAITSKGIVGALNGSAKFSITAAGNATFSGDITGGTISIGASSNIFKVDSSGNMWLGASTFASAPFKVSAAGAVTATSGTFGGIISTTNYVIASGNITDSGNQAAIIGKNTNHDGWAVVGITSAPLGIGAIYGSASTGGYGVYGTGGVGVYGIGSTGVQAVGSGAGTGLVASSLSGTAIQATSTTGLAISASGNVSVTGSITATSNITAYSDIRLKEDLQPISSALEKVKQLTGYTYTQKDTKKRHTGLVAQDVQKVLPEAIEEDEYLSVAYGNLVGLLVEAIKELDRRINK